MQFLYPALQLLRPILQLLYAVATVGLAIYGFNALWLTWKSHRYRSLAPQPQDVESLGNVGSAPRAPSGGGHGAVAAEMERVYQNRETDVAFYNWPTVTVQLPIYNEQHVVERLVEACAQLRYPTHRLQIQVLDDSTDHTVEIVERCVARWQQRGCNIEMVHRENRVGYKAGALQNALPAAAGDFIAIFDADFVPEPDFLLRTLPALLRDESLAFVQTRWGHLNPEYSVLTRSQALALDGHFVVEQAARQAAGYAFGFNGSAGIWRRACIEDEAVGGWHTDTLCEDLDLSYRAQLAGWRPHFLRHVEVPAEIPPQLSAFKRQQARWAQGSIQALRKLTGTIWRSEWTLARKVQGTIHLGSYLLHPLLLVLLLVSLPLTLLHIDTAWPLAYLSIASVGPPLLYAVAQRRLHPGDWLNRWAYIGVLTLLGFGLCLSNSWAVWRGWSGRGGQFLRTPKFRVQSNGDGWRDSIYRLSMGPISVGEFILLLYALAVALAAALRSEWWTLLFSLLYVGGFTLMLTVELWQDRPVRPGRRPAPAENAAPVRQLSDESSVMN